MEETNKYCFLTALNPKKNHLQVYQTVARKVNYKKLVYLSGQQYLWYLQTAVRCAAYMLNGIKQSLLKIDQ